MMKGKVEKVEKQGKDEGREEERGIKRCTGDFCVAENISFHKKL